MSAAAWRASVTSELERSANCWELIEAVSKSVFNCVSFGRRSWAACSREEVKTLATSGSFRRAERKTSRGGEAGRGCTGGVKGFPAGSFRDR